MSSVATEHVTAPVHRIHNSTSQPLAARDRFYGHAVYSEAAERYIMTLFACSQNSVSATQEYSSTSEAPRLAHFIAYALYRTRLPVVVSYHALILLKRLKKRYPAARGSSGHRLFIAAYMLASKMICDDSYNNKSWTIVCQGLLSLREVNQMERELIGYLALDINATGEELTAFASEFELYGAPRISLEELCELRLLPSRATQPAPVGEYKRMSTPACTNGGNPIRLSRSSSHRRCTSLRPDIWTHGSSANSSASIDTGAAARARRMAMRAHTPHRHSHNATPAPAQTPSYINMSELRTPPQKSMYTTSNTSSVSITTPGSLSSSTRVTPTTSMSEIGSSPWGDMRNLAAGLPQFPTPPHHEPYKLYSYAEYFHRPFSPQSANLSSRAVFCPE